MAAYSQINEMKEDEEFDEFFGQLFFRQFDELHLYTGSCFELPLIYFLENVTDIDNIKYSGNICAIKKEATAPKDFKGTVLIIHSQESHPGFARLYFKNNNKPYIYAIIPEERPAISEVVLERTHITSYLSSEFSHTNKWLENFQGLSRDVVDAIWCPNWPEEANEWIVRERLHEWPLTSTVNRIVNNGCFLVAKPHQESQLFGNEWRFSFSEAELILVHTWNDAQMYIYHILRLIKTNVVRKCGGKKMAVLTTYHIKTLMFWACEVKSKEFWLPDNIESSVKELLIDMTKWLIEKKCRNYFIPGNNMLDHFPNSHDFELEAQFLVDWVELVHCVSSTVSSTENNKVNRSKKFSVRIPINLLLAVHLRVSIWSIIDPSKPERQMYKPCTAIENNHLFRSDIFDLFQCLKIHRRLVLARKFEEKLIGMQEIEECFKWARDKKVGGFTYVDISPMDNFHVIMKKLLRKTLDDNKSDKSHHKHAQSIRFQENSTQWELCYSRTEALERINITYILEMLSGILNDKIVTPSCFHSAAYEANFYWTIFAEERNYNTWENWKKALDICNKWLCYAKSIQDTLCFIAGIGVHKLPIIISNRWSVIFDRYIQVVLGFLSLVKATTKRRFHSNCKASSESMASDVLVQVYPIDLLGYIRYQCKFYLKEYCILDDSFTHGMQNDITKMFLYAAARIGTESRQAINFHD